MKTKLLNTKLILTLCFLGTFLTSIAQEGLQLEAGKLVHSGSIKSSECPTDLQGNPCARVVVEIPLPEVKISGSYMLKNSDYDVRKVTGGYQFWVSTAPGSEKQEITVSHDNYYSTKFFLVCDGERLHGREEYKIVIELPKMGTVLFITNGIKNCVINVDGQAFITDDNGKTSVSLPPGAYEFTAQASGFKKYHGNITVSSDGFIEQQIELIPTDKHTEAYIKYRVEEIFKDRSGELAKRYASADYLRVHEEYISEFKKDEMYDGFTDAKWFCSDPDDLDGSTISINFCKIQSDNTNKAIVKFVVTNVYGDIEQQEFEMLFDSNRGDWVVDDCILQMSGSDKEEKKITTKQLSHYNKF